jgi:cysteine desulfurase
MKFDNDHVTKLSKKLYDKLTRELKDIYLNGDEQNRYPGNLNISFAYVEGESLIMAVKGLAVSSG